jgi:hypothetical protein
MNQLIFLGMGKKLCKFWVSFSWRKHTNQTFIWNLNSNTQQIIRINRYAVHENLHNVQFSETKNTQYHDTRYNNLSNTVIVPAQTKQCTSSKNKLISCSAYIYFVCECAKLLCAICITFREDTKNQGCFTTEKWVPTILPMYYSMMNCFFFTFVLTSHFTKHANSNKTAAMHTADSANRLNDINL